jgi:hypothetical protein
MLPLYVNANEVKEQKVNEYSGGFKVDSVNFSYFAVSFSGYAGSEGEVVFEMVPDDGYEHEIYKIEFIPNDTSIFPSISDGFYSKKLYKIGLLNHSKVKELLFTDEEWAEVVLKKQRYVSVRASIVLDNYGTSVECDSRHYYADILGVTKDKVSLAYHSVRADVSGCYQGGQA